MMSIQAASPQRLLKTPLQLYHLSAGKVRVVYIGHGARVRDKAHGAFLVIPKVFQKSSKYVDYS